MRYIADLHVHSHYSRATSKDLNLESLYQWAKIKGINVVGTGDFTHPQWFRELNDKLEPDGNGFFRLKHPSKDPAIPGIRTQDIDVRFCLTTEISSIYKHGDRVRKNHNLVYAPDLDTVARINHKLSSIGNLEADGRPILGLPSRDLLEIVLETSERAYLIPAHIWTPWFSTLGSKAGYDSIQACFRDLTGHLFALETGLSSDPAMNWKLSNLDNYTLISNSDAHSPSKLGREANLLDTELSYDGMFEAFKTGKGFSGTYEFFPEEGKYHRDGHRKCNISLDPRQSIAYDNICPECGKPLTVGVLHRVEALADRESYQKPARAAGYDYIIPLPEVIGEIEGVGPKTKTVRERFRQVISNFGNEFTLLREVPVEDIQKQNEPVLAEAVRRIRENEVDPTGGYDGVYGTIKIFKEGEIDRLRGQLGFFGIDEYRIKETVTCATEPDRAYKSKRKTKKSKEEVYTLNKEQREVVDSATGTTLVKAGPGTGKTHTLVEWITRQVESGMARPAHILAVTFTNKAADELRERLKKRIGDRARSMSIGTFHAIAWRWLRERHPELNTVYDSTNRRMALKILFPDLAASEITKLNESIAGCLELGQAVPDRWAARLRSYQEYLQDHGAADLSGLIRDVVQGWKQDPGWLNQIQSRFKAIAADEFQDINPLQYEMVTLLAVKSNSTLVIGDPDQAIYGFRGSDAELFFRFAEETKAKEVALRRNYRSTDIILKAAGAVIRNNSLRSDVALLTENHSQTPLFVFRAADPFKEADYIVEQVKSYVGGTESLTSGDYTDSQHSYGFGDISVLFRTRAVGKALFKAFGEAGIPAHFSDATPFFEEPPFSLIPVLLHLQSDARNTIALSNILEEAYGWEPSQINSLLSHLNTSKTTLFEDENWLEARSSEIKKDLTDLKAIHQKLARSLESGGMKPALELIFSRFLPDKKLEDVQRFKKEALLELASHQDFGKTPDVKAFLEQMQLNPYTDAGRIKTESVHLLTFHAAKGLEFPVVFIAGTEEGITPILRQDSAIDMEEERRLFYVAMTRARDELQITCSKERARYGEIKSMKPSRFIDEIPAKLRQKVHDKKTENREQKNKKAGSKQLKLL